MFDALKKSMIDAIEEGQLKLGYRDETIRLYYPLESLCALTGKKLDAAQMMRELEAFFTEDEAELLAVFNRYGDRVHVEELHNGEFDWLISFEDGQPDAYRYCIADEGCHLTYHRFTKEDYEAFGF